MNSRLRIDLFAEDRSHQQLLVPLLCRLAGECRITAAVQVRSARGGHGRALTELDMYQDSVLGGVAGMVVPDLLVVAIDANCNTLRKAHKEILAHVHGALQSCTVVACPDPHIERWYLADPASFAQVVGAQPRLGRKKCQRGYYKSVLAEAVQKGGNHPMLGGIEFARELVDNMDMDRATRNDRALKAFVSDLRSALKAFVAGV